MNTFIILSMENYNKVNKSNLSNFYFCQFYKTINLKKTFFCALHIKDI